MKKDIHPTYHPVVYHDTSAGIEFTSRSTQKSGEVRKIDGVDHYVIRVEISAASHPFYTGKQKFVDTAGRIEKFQKKFAGKYGTAVAEAKAVEAKAATQKAVETRAAEAKAAQAKAIAVKAAAAKAAAAKTAAAPPKQ